MEEWIDGAVDQLSKARFSCALDAAEANHGAGMTELEIAQLLGVTRQAVGATLKRALAKMGSGANVLESLDIDGQDQSAK